MKQSELLRKQADMMDMAEKHGIDDWRMLIRGCSIVAYGCDTAWFGDIGNVEFAIGVVEGKSVFKGDKLYVLGEKVEVVSKHDQFDSLQWNGISYRGTTGLLGVPLKDWSWNPPKPKTVMVELPIDLVTRESRGAWTGAEFNVACLKALESIKK